jgi:hypothetical protein
MASNETITKAYTDTFNVAKSKGMNNARAHVLALHSVALVTAEKTYEAVRSEIRPPRNGDTPKYSQRDHDVIVNAALNKAAKAAYASLAGERP